MYASSGVCFLALGVATAIGLTGMADNVVVSWPAPPRPPASIRPAVIGSLPLPPGWNTPVEAEEIDNAGDPSATADPVEEVAATVTQPPVESARAPAEPVPVTPGQARVARANPEPTNAVNPPATRSRPASVPPAEASTLPPASTQASTPRTSSLASRLAAETAADRPSRTSEPAPSSEVTAIGSARSAEPLPPPGRPATTSARDFGAMAPVDAAANPRARSGNAAASATAPATRLDPVHLGDAPPTANTATAALVRTPPRVDARDSVRRTIERYRSAYQQLDAAAARAVWPAVDSGALARAFGSLASQEVWFEGCSIDVSGASASANCTGHSRVVPKVGGGSETARRTWQFALKQAGDSWVIEKATVK